MRNIGVKLTKHSYNHFNKEEISIRRDEVFKIVFGSEINKGYLKSFIEAILKRKITDIKVKSEVSLEKIYNKNRLIKVDILAEIDKKELVNIEIQNKKDYNIIKRTEAHASKIFYNSLESGDEYREAKKTIIIWILDFNYFKDGPYHEISKTVRKSNGEVLSVITNDIDTLSMNLNQSITEIIRTVCIVVGIIIMMISINWQMTIAALILLPVAAILIKVIVSRSQKYFKRQQNYLAVVNRSS